MLIHAFKKEVWSCVDVFHRSSMVCSWGSYEFVVTFFLLFFFCFFGGSSCIGQIGILMFGLFVHRRCLDMLFKRSWAVCRWCVWELVFGPVAIGYPFPYALYWLMYINFLFLMCKLWVCVGWGGGLLASTPVLSLSEIPVCALTFCINVFGLVPN